MTIDEYRMKLQRIDIMSMLEAILESLDKDIVKLVQEQLWEGKRGDELMPRYSENTIIDKKERNAILAGERIALIDSGEFWESLFSYVSGGEFGVDSQNRLRDELTERYSEDIFLIGTKQMEYLRSLVSKRLTDEFNRAFS